MNKEYIKGHLYKEIYRNEMNGYMVALFKIKETNTSFEDNIINITGVLPSLSDKKEYILYGEIANHKKYGIQFNVSSFDIVMPSKEEELVTFLSSDLFPIGEKTAEKIVSRYKEETINKILEDDPIIRFDSTTDDDATRWANITINGNINTNYQVIYNQRWELPQDFKVLNIGNNTVISVNKNLEKNLSLILKLTKSKKEFESEAEKFVKDT